MKKRLVLTMGCHSGTSKKMPQQYAAAKQYWECEVSIEGEGGVVDEYDIVPDRKLYLNDFLDLMRAELNKFDESDSSVWGAKLYRIFKK